MARPSNARGGGVLVAVGLIAGAVAGVLAGEPTIGLLAGGAVGATAALAHAATRPR